MVLFHHVSWMCPKHIQKTYRFGSFSTIGGLPVKMVPTSTNFFLIIYSNSQKHSHVLSNWKKWHCSDSALFLRSLYAYVDERIHGVHAMIRAQSKQYIRDSVPKGSLHPFIVTQRSRDTGYLESSGTQNVRVWAIYSMNLDPLEKHVYIYIYNILYISIHITKTHVPDATPRVFFSSPKIALCLRRLRRHFYPIGRWGVELFEDSR